MANYYGNSSTSSNYGSRAYGSETTPSYHTAPAAHSSVQYGAYGAKVTVASNLHAAYGADSYQSHSSSGGYNRNGSSSTSYSMDATAATYGHSLSAGSSYGISGKSLSTGYGSSSYGKPTNWQRETNSFHSSSTPYASGSGSYISSHKSGISATSGSSAAADSETSYSASEHSGLNAAVLSAATSYLRGESTQKHKNYRDRFRAQSNPALTKYCELCKCSCVGQQAYQMHLEGRSHKKKEEMLKAGGATGSVGSAAKTHGGFYCELCDVPCTSSDAFTAHNRGIKHQKVLRLQQRLGKPIPESSTVAAVENVQTMVKPTAVPSTGGRPVIKTVVSTPKITFIGGTKLQTTNTGEMKEVKIDDKPQEKTSTSAVMIGPTKPPITKRPADGGDIDAGDEGIQPVGLEYIEESMNQTKTAPSFFCKLCDCNFTDAQAKDMHSKGRRHRLAYKKKVDPTFRVDDIKPSMTKFGRMKNEPWRKKEHSAHLKMQAEELRYEKEMLLWQLMKQYETPVGGSMLGGMGGGSMFGAMGGGSMLGGMGGGSMLGGMGGGSMLGGMGGGGMGYSMHGEVRTNWPTIIGTEDMHPNQQDERDLMMKHTDIYPNVEELEAVQSTIADCERALKLISDSLTSPALAVNKDQTAATPNAEPSQTETTELGSADPVVPATVATVPAERVLKGVTRIGCLAKGLLLHEQLDLDVVVLCAKKPTRKLLIDILTNLPIQLKTFTETIYKVELSVDATFIVMTRCSDGPTTKCNIMLTSQTVPDASQPQDSTDIPLGDDVCAVALTQIRRSKWFQAKVSCLSPCVTVIRILMEFCSRIPTWNPLSQWLIELLVERVVASYERPLTPTGAVMRFFEFVASGILLPGGPGLRDPCEKLPTDALEYLSIQQAEDIANSAQHALRMIAFGQLSRVLNLPIPASVPEAVPSVQTTSDTSLVSEPPSKRPKINT